MLGDLIITDTDPATHSVYVGSAFAPDTGIPATDPSSRDDYLEGTPGTAVYSERPGVPNALDLQSDGCGAVYGGITFGEPTIGTPHGQPAFASDPDRGYSPIRDSDGTWYDNPRDNPGYPLPVPHDAGGYSEMPSANDGFAMAAGQSFPIDAYVRFEQPELVADGYRITERTLDIPVEWKRNPTFPAQIQRVRPWDKFLGAWPWTGTKAATNQPVVSPPLYFPNPLPDGVVSPSGAANATIPNTPSLSPQPMTYRIIPEQWADNFVQSGV
jgi:hypothetical protein